MSSGKNIQGSILNDAIIKDVRDAVAGLDFGTVLIKVHGAKIIQIEVTSRLRFDDAWKLEGGAGI
ncbi:MAG: DUF2292 domain-containing protein [Candidatus Omnitrophota bacterium]